MIQTEIKKLETEMLNIANEIVGDVGDNVNPDLYFKHQVGSFCINRTELDHRKNYKKKWDTMDHRISGFTKKLQQSRVCRH